MTEWEWHKDAACKDQPVDLFYATASRAVSAAKRVCARCPVADPCLAYALNRTERYGVWGGKTLKQRNTLRLRQASRAAQAPPTPGEPKSAVEVEKLCTRCGVIQPVSAFSADKTKPQGLRAWCKGCVNEAARRRREQVPS